MLSKSQADWAVSVVQLKDIFILVSSTVILKVGLISWRSKSEIIFKSFKC